MPRLPNTPEFHVEGAFTDHERGVLYYTVTAEGLDGEERVEVNAQEMARAAHDPSIDLQTILSARVRDAVARLAGYRNHAEMVRDAKRQIRHAPLQQQKEPDGNLDSDCGPDPGNDDGPGSQASDARDQDGRNGV